LPPTDDDYPDWVDTSQPASWDPWGDPDATAEDRGLNRTLGEWLVGVVPPEAQLHFYNAGREFVAGVEATLAHHMGPRPEDLGDDHGQPVRIEIE